MNNISQISIFDYTEIENLGDFGKDCAVDGKYLDSYGNQFYENKANDDRGEHEATSSCKTYYMKDGTTKKNGIMNIEPISYMMQNMDYQ